MTDAYKISVIVPCFNHGEFVAEAVASVTSLKRNDIEVIVVDDGSTDERTSREMEKLAEQGTRVIRQENKGLAAARNAAIRAAQGQYVFPLDADDVLRHGWIDRAVRIFDERPEVGVVYGDPEFFGARTGRWRAGPFDLERMLAANYIAVSALYRRVIWEQNGGYDGTMPVQGLEDWDFWLGAVEHGWQFVYLSEVFFGYRQHRNSMLARAHPFEKQTQEFIARKHGALYRSAWLPYLESRLSLKRTFRHLLRLLVFRVRTTLGDSTAAPPRPEAAPAQHSSETAES